MEEINDIVFSNEPPFDTSSGGFSTQKPLTTYQKKIYNDALLYAQKNKDPQPELFAKKLAESTNISYGKNNPFGELASKLEPGTIKDGVKYKNYSNLNIPLSRKYNEYLQDQHNAQLESEVPQIPMDNNLEQTQQPSNIQEQPQSIDIPVNQNNQQINIPQNTTSLNIKPDIYSKNYSDRQSQANNPIQQLEAINPIQQPFAMGGSINETSENELNSYNVGGTHESNPNGGIPQGMGSNGKQNTVEEGETSYNIEGNKFIFSNRIFL